MSIISPYIPPISPYGLPYQPFDDLINAYGIRLLWCKSHSCPCSYSSQIPGSPDPQCQTCHGRGIYWDAPYGPFTGLITFIHMSPAPDEPGTITSTDQGGILRSEPALTIPYAASNVWAEASLYDLYVEVDSISRYFASLQVGQRTWLPYNQNVAVAASGAVTVYDSVNHIVVPTNSYTVSGATVTLNGYPENTPYTVEFTAAPTYVAYRIAGSTPHVRPFGEVTEPKRYRLQTLDLWTRQTLAGDIPSP